MEASTAELRNELSRRELDEAIETAANKVAFSLEGLIRSVTKGDGGREYADKCKREIGDGLAELVKLVRS